MSNKTNKEFKLSSWAIDHSTIVYAVQKIEGRIEVYPTYKNKYEHYLNLLE